MNRASYFSILLADVCYFTLDSQEFVCVIG